VVPTADEGEAITKEQGRAGMRQVLDRDYSRKGAQARCFYFLDQREKSVNSSIAPWRRGVEGESWSRASGRTRR